ncbi:MAG: hypothetical protein U9R42_01720 [Bacteroidota bacterium]|nr:hypothetical protein [Bacteroidota bacterium]
MQLQRYYKILILLIIIQTILFSCKKHGKYYVNVKDIDVEVNIKRFDEEVYKLKKDNFNNEFTELHKKYPDVFEVFIERIARAGSVNDSLYFQRMENFIFDKYSQELYQDVHKMYDDISWLEDDVTEAFKHIKYYFPKDTLPEVYSLVSNFGFGTGTFENMMFISLDLFLGSDYKYYPSLFPNYRIKYLNKNYIVSEFLKAYFTNKFPEEQQRADNLLSTMIYAGKKMFFLDLMLTDVADSIKIRYSKEEIKWCKKNEGELWKQLVENDVLYETNSRKIMKYIDDGPFTNAYGIPQDSPARLGQWIGWQIVKNYVKNNDESSLIKIFYESDSQKILSLSKYKPKF